MLGSRTSVDQAKPIKFFGRNKLNIKKENYKYFSMLFNELVYFPCFIVINDLFRHSED